MTRTPLGAARARSAFAAGALALTLVLSGCVSADPEAIDGDDSSETDRGSGGSGGGSGGRAEADALGEALDCLQGVWNEDMVNLLAQWQSSSPGGQGLPVTELVGANTLTVDADSMVYSVESVTKSAMNLGGLERTGEATTQGSATFDYRASSPTKMLVGPVTEQSVTSISRVFVDGELSIEQELPWDGGIEGEAIWWCEGDTLSLEPSVSGWIHVFTRRHPVG